MTKKNFVFNYHKRIQLGPNLITFSEAVHFLSDFNSLNYYYQNNQTGLTDYEYFIFYRNGRSDLRFKYKKIHEIIPYNISKIRKQNSNKIFVNCMENSP